MTPPTDRHSSGSSPRTTPRLRLKPKAPAIGHVDGAWWPCSNDLARELPDLLAVLSVRLGGYNRQPVDTVEVIGRNRKNIHLLVVSSETDSDWGHTIMMSAAVPGDTSTVAALLRGERVDGSLR